VRSHQPYPVRRPLVARAPKGRQAVAWWRKPQVRAKPGHSHSFNILSFQAPEWGRQGRAWEKPFDTQRAVVNGFAALSLLRSSGLGKSRGYCRPRPRTWGLRRQATTCRRVRGSNPEVDRRALPRRRNIFALRRQATTCRRVRGSNPEVDRRALPRRRNIFAYSASSTIAGFSPTGHHPAVTGGGDARFGRCAPRVDCAGATPPCPPFARGGEFVDTEVRCAGNMPRPHRRRSGRLASVRPPACPDRQNPTRHSRPNPERTLAT
jgi:hypothetical protein